MPRPLWVRHLSWVALFHAVIQGFHLEALQFQHTTFTDSAKGEERNGKAHCLSTIFAWKLVTCIQNPLARTSHMAPTQPQRRVERVRECMPILWAITASVIMLLLLQAAAQRAPPPWSSTSCPFPRRRNCFIFLYIHSALIYILIANIKAQVL